MGRACFSGHVVMWMFGCFVLAIGTCFSGLYTESNNLLGVRGEETGRV